LPRLHTCKRPGRRAQGGSSFSSGFRGFGQLHLDQRGLTGPAYAATGVPQLLRNPLAWSTAANVLAWEAPPGVGFSYCPEEADRLGWTDQRTAADSADFLEGLVARHPAYRGRRFFVFGSSYAGMYIPMLADEILKVRP
jgi:carboxypeptidase C (cathepsin A)